MKIVLIGTGNVATVFGRLLTQSGNPIVQVYGRNAADALVLANELNSVACSSWDDITPLADLYIIAISDKSLYDLDRHLALNDRLVVHTAGSVPMAVLKNVSSCHGVVYPLQSLRKNMPVLTEIPLLINASDDATMQRLWNVARCISDQVTTATDEQRMKMHIAAVFVNNFVNHLYAIAEMYCEEEHIAFSRLLPLAAETARRLNEVSPQQVLTGPAVRNDQVTISTHLNMLAPHPDVQALYTQLTNSIISYSKKRQQNNQA